MNNSFSKEEILKSIRNANGFQAEKLIMPDSDSPVFKKIDTSLIDCFKKELEAVSGHCVVVNSEADLAKEIQQYIKEKNITSLFCKDKAIASFLDNYKIPNTLNKSDFMSMQLGVTDCEFLVARTGTVVVSSKGESGRQMNIFPPTHIVIAKKNQVLASLEEALIAIKNKYGSEMPSLVSFISGPSRTADIEKTLVLGAHGPKELYVYISE